MGDYMSISASLQSESTIRSPLTAERVRRGEFVLSCYTNETVQLKCIPEPSADGGTPSANAYSQEEVVKHSFDKFRKYVASNLFFYPNHHGILVGESSP